MKNNIKNYGKKRNKMNNNSLLDFVNQVPEKKKEKLLDFVKNIPKKEKKTIPETKGTTPYEIIELMEQARPILQSFPGGPQILPLLTKLPTKEKARIYQEAIFAGISPGAWAAYTTLQQAKNIAATKIKGEKYDPLARERLTQFIPEKVAQIPTDPIGLALPSLTGIAPKIPLKTGADIMETAMDYLIAQKGIRPAARKIASFQPTKTILIEPKKIKDIFQTGKLISKEEMEVIKDLGLSGPGYREAIKKGIKIKVPVSKMEFLKNKVYWNKTKGLFKGVKEAIPKPSVPSVLKPVSPEKSLIRTEAEILKATHKSDATVMKYVKDTVANGENLRKITEKVIAGTIPKTEAVKEVAKDIEKLEKPKVKPEIKKPVIEKVPEKEEPKVAHWKYVERYPDLPKQIANSIGYKYKLNTQQKEDLTQDLMIKLGKVDWDKHKEAGKDIKNYISTSLRNAAMDIHKPITKKAFKTVALEDLVTPVGEDEMRFKVTKEKVDLIDKETGEAISQIKKMITEPGKLDPGYLKVETDQLLQIYSNNPALDNRERGYIRLALKGLSQKEIAKKMNFSEGQISKIASSVKNKSEEYPVWKLASGRKLLKELVRKRQEDKQILLHSFPGSLPDMDLIFKKPFGKEESKIVLRKRIAEKEQKIQKAAKDLEKIESFFDKQSKEFNIDFIGKMERGQTDLYPKQLKVIAKELRNRLDVAYQRDKSIESKLDFIENYFPHIWKNPKNAERFVGNYVKKFVHTPAFVKKRYHEFISDGLESGLELKTSNPVDLVLMREEASYHNEMTKNILEDFKELKLLKFKKGIRRPEFGWKGIKGERLRRYFPTEKGVVLAGEFVAPEAVANVLNNWLSPSLWYNQGTLGKGFRGVMKVKNMQVAIMLSLSGFHAIETGLSSIASNLVLSTFQIARGNIISGLANMVKSPFSPFISVVSGWEGRNAWYKGPKTEYQKHALDLLIRAGARPSTDRVWRIGALKNFKKSLLTGNYPGAIVDFIPAICEFISKPIMDIWVPQLKTYAFLQRASDFVKSHSDMSQMEQDKKLTKIWDSIDNRFGQLVYDNLFWDRTIKDIMIASSLSLGWNLGNIREFGGGAYDIAKIFSAWGKGKKPEVTERTLYTLIYPIVVGIFGGLLTYGLTGKKPEKLLDYYAPKTGNINPDGSAERLTLPAGTKEFFASREAIRKHGFISGPAVYLSHKAAPLISETISMLRNRDYYNVEIRNPNAPAVKQAYQLFEFMVTAQKPFSISGYLRQKEIGRPTILPFLGMNPAPGYITKTKIQKEIGDLYVARFGQAVKSKEMWEKSQFRKKLRERIQRGEKLSTAEARKLVKDGLISFTWIKKMRKLQIQGVLGRGDVVMFQRLNKEDQETLIKRMTKEEKSFYMKYAKKDIRLEYRKERLRR